MSIVQETLRLLEAAREKTDTCAVAYSGGKDSACVLDLCVRVFPKVHAFFLATIPGLDCVKEALEYPVRKYGVQVTEFQHPLLGDWVYNGIYCDDVKSAEAIPAWSMSDAWDLARHELGAGCIAIGAKRSDGVWRRRQLKKSVNMQDWLLYPIVGWSKMEVWGYIQTRGLKAHLSPQGRAFEISLVPENVLWLYDNWRSDYEKMKAWFPYVEAIVKRREWYGEQKATR